ncbi:hypothetical protein J7337_007293 [Fusarium musae]|uniref:PNPLA domain-containing protein n=1 Tax=Fusarium musae TaxID=1042133 RepID=A0A9P8DGL9_9HYPO|nr:hypothetical protein J7337_007293 [Fusarium musae]KAG9501602.1 hypothetical protein J7337_007293 [Fusarium musae]
MTTSPSEDSGTLQHQVNGASSAEIDPSIPIRGPEHISYEEGPWANKTILSFDGGGVRGYASLLVLKGIMLRIRELEHGHEDYRAPSSDFYRWNGVPEENIAADYPESDRVDRYLPCHYFDYVAGTSTGGIAISWSIKKDGGVSKEFVWRSYDNEPSPKEPKTNQWNPSNAGPAHTTAIWEVARATTAAPGYFESIKIIGRKFLDGGMAANNPSLIALKEIHNLHGLVPDLFVSIGTGLKPSSDDQNGDVPSEANGHTAATRRDTIRDGGRRKQFVKKYWEIGKFVKSWMVDCEGPVGTEGWRDRCNAIDLTDSYRLNVKGDLHTIPLDDWRPSDSGEKTLGFIEEQTRQYLADPSVIECIDSIASKAVEIRRRRAATEQWERFAVDVIYRCDACENKKYETRAQLREHLQKGIAHLGEKIADGKQLEERLNDSRSFKPKRPVETRS